MPSTSKGYPYPAATDVPDVPADIQSLADAINAGLPRKVQVGSFTMSITASTTGTASPTFGSAFTGTPTIICQTANNAYTLSVASPSTTGFTCNARHIDGTSTTTSFTVYYIAIHNA